MEVSLKGLCAQEKDVSNLRAQSRNVPDFVTRARLGEIGMLEDSLADRRKERTPYRAKMQLVKRSHYRQYRFIEIKGHSGSHYYTGETLRDVLKNGYGAAEIRYGWQSFNPEKWQSWFRYPSYGFGWYNGFIGNPDVLGTPSAAYGFISFPFARLMRHQFVIEPALGLSYDLNPYDGDKNVNNDAIGSRVNVYFNLSVGGQYPLTRELDLVYGFDLTHFSNGRIRQPNSGLNMIGPNVGIRYHYNVNQNRIDRSLHPETVLPVRPVFRPFGKPARICQGSFQFYLGAGMVQNGEDKGSSRRFSTCSAILEYLYKLNKKSGFAAGFDFFRDNSLEERYPGENYNLYGGHLGYDLMFWRMALRLQAGSYLHRRGWDFKGNYFFRPALMFDIGKRYFAQVGLKTKNGFVADWVEFGAGIRFLTLPK